MARHPTRRTVGTLDRDRAPWHLICTTGPCSCQGGNLRTAEHLLDLAGLDLGREGVEGGREVVLHRLALVDPIDEDAEVLRLPPQGLGEVAVVLQPPAAPQQVLRPVRIAPEIGGGGAGL